MSSIDFRKKTTRADVAKYAGISPATVSYVVNNGPKHVSEETRQKVLQAIDELGYRPDPVALSFRGSDSNAIGMLVPNFNGPFFSDLVAEVERQASRRGKAVLVGSTGYHPNARDKMLQTFWDRRIDAVLVIGPTPNSGTSAVAQGALNVMRLDCEQIVPVGIAQRSATRAAVQHLISHNCRRIAAIFGPTEHKVFSVRYRGWRDATGLPTEQTKQLVRRAAYSFQGGFDAAMELFDQRHTPDGLFVSNDTQAVGAISALHKLGLAVPGDVSVVSIDDAQISPFLIPSLTSVRQPIDLIAEAALNIVETPAESAPNYVQVPFTIEIRDSCGCTTASARKPGET